jgi:hypothetical protein
MNTIQLHLLGMLLAIVILWIGNRIRTSAFENEGANRWLGFFVASLAILLASLIFSMPVESRLASTLWSITIPVAAGILAIILLKLITDRTIWTGRNPKMLFLFLIVISEIIWLAIFGDLFTALSVTLTGIFAALVGWMWGRIGKKYLLVGIIQIILLSVSLWAAESNYRFIDSPIWIAVIGLPITFFPAFVIAVAGYLIFDILSGSLSKDMIKIPVGVILVVITVFALGYQMYLASVWDVATDGLGAPVLWMLISIASIVAAMLIAWLLSGPRQLIAFAFAGIMLLTLQYPNWFGTYGPDGEWGDSPAYITEHRAEKINQAIQSYYESHGEYPNSLWALFPQNLVYIPRPMMIPGQTWCYEGGQNYYRLGYVYRQYFSSQASVQIHAYAGEPPNSYWPCEAEAAKFPGPFSNPRP